MSPSERVHKETHTDGNLGIVGDSIELLEIRETIRQVAPTDITVLITGESGVGKEVVARALHALSHRSAQPLVTVNCGAIPEGIIESELFGHEKGSFTSAVDTRKGYFEIADGGTILLDEIGEMPMATQVKLLRVLESGEFMRVGASTPRHSDVRVIAATNKDLAFEVQQKKFRSDLYFRLRSVNIWIPPLRQRRTDIPILVDHFAQELTEKNGIRFEGFSSDAIQALMNYNWPGNVRELRNVLESMLVLENGRRLNGPDVHKYLQGDAAAEGDRHLPMVTSKTVEQAERELIYRALLDLKSDMLELKEHVLGEGSVVGRRESVTGGKNEGNGSMSIQDMEKELIIEALDRNKGNRRLAARDLRISERTLYRKIKEYNLNG